MPQFHAPERGHSRTDLPAFFALAFAWSWTCWWAAARCAASAPLASAILGMLGSFGPGVGAAFVVVRRGGAADLSRWFRRRLQWRVGWRWYALAFLLPPVAMLSALVLHAAIGGAVDVFPAAHHLALAVANFGIVFVVGGPLGEEFGWRGYALPALRRRMGWRGAGLLLGLVWALWHLPLFLMPGSAQAALPWWLFVPGTVALSVVFAWLSRRTRGSVVPALVLHTAMNGWAAVIPVMPSHGSEAPYALLTGLMVALAIALMWGEPRTLAVPLRAGDHDHPPRLARVVRVT